MNFTLEEFLSYRENPSTKEYLSLPAESWLVYYDIAKHQYEKYGDSPPIGSKVITLVSGHGGGPGCIRTLSLDEKYKDYYVLTRDDGVSLVNKNYWYRHFSVLTEDENETRVIKLVIHNNL